MGTHAPEKLRIYAHILISSAFSLSEIMLRPVSLSLVAVGCQDRQGPRFVIVSVCYCSCLFMLCVDVPGILYLCYLYTSCVFDPCQSRDDDRAEVVHGAPCA